MATSSAEPTEDLSSRERRRVVGWAVVRTITAVALVVAIYFLTPLGHRTNAGRVVELGVGLLALIAVIAWQLRQIIEVCTPERPCRRGTRVLRPALHPALCDGVLPHGACERSGIRRTHDPD